MSRSAIVPIRVKCQDLLNEVGDDVYLVLNGRIVDPESYLEPNSIYHVCYRLCGGKGGFGSMLRTIGAQIEKTTNREAMRDLSGRRLRDVNNEKKLAEWVAGAADRERKKEQQRQERLEKRRAEAQGPAHKYLDQKYMDQKEKVLTNLEDAVAQGLKRASTAAVSSTSDCPPSKKGKSKAASSTAWLGIDSELLSSSDDDNEQKDNLLPDSFDKEGSSTSSSITTDQRMHTASPETTDNCVESIAVCSTNSSLDVPFTNDSSNKDANTETSDSQNPSAAFHTSEASHMPIELENYKSAKELEAYGLEALKLELTRRGLKCGGSLAQRAERLFSVKGLEESEINPSIKAKK